MSLRTPTSQAEQQTASLLVCVQRNTPRDLPLPAPRRVIKLLTACRPRYSRFSKPGCLQFPPLSPHSPPPHPSWDFRHSHLLFLQHLNAASGSSCLRSAMLDVASLPFLFPPCFFCDLLRVTLVSGFDSNEIVLNQVCFDSFLDLSLKFH